METQTSNTKGKRKFHNTIKWTNLKKPPLFTNCKSMGVGPFAYFDQGSFASLNDKI
jgi:hypothetical protein